MRSITAEEAREQLPELLKGICSEPILINDDGEDVAVLVSPQRFRQDYLQRVEEFRVSRDVLAAEFALNLKREGKTPEEFLKELFDEIDEERK